MSSALEMDGFAIAGVDSVSSVVAARDAYEKNKNANTLAAYDAAVANALAAEAALVPAPGPAAYFASRAVIADINDIKLNGASISKATTLLGNLTTIAGDEVKLTGLAETPILLEAGLGTMALGEVIDSIGFVLTVLGGALDFGDIASFAESVLASLSGATQSSSTVPLNAQQTDTISHEIDLAVGGGTTVALLSTGASSNSTTETYTGSVSGNNVIATGNLGDTITITSSGGVATIASNDNSTVTQTYSPSGQLQSGAWTNSIGTHGADIYNADSSSSSTVTYADGNYATTIDDGQGNITTDYYSKDGIEIRSTWMHSDGTSGVVSLYNDGLTVAPGGGTPESSLTTTQNPDGTYSITGVNSEDQFTDIAFSSGGTQTTESVGSGLGQNVLTPTPAEPAGSGVSSAIIYNGAGVEVGSNWRLSSGVGGEGMEFALEDGWGPNATAQQSDESAWGSYLGNPETYASAGYDYTTASGAEVFYATSEADGTNYQTTTFAQGITYSHLSASGNLISDQWATGNPSSEYIDGFGDPAINATVTGTDSFNADGSGTGTFQNLLNGTSGTITLNGQGDIVVVNTNASGVVTSEDVWNGSTGTYQISTLNPGGTTLNAYQYLPNGNVIVTDYAPDWTTIADQETVAQGLVVNPDGSDFSKIMNSDGSYTVYYQDSSGDTTAWQYSSSGQLTGSYHTNSDGLPGASWSGTLSDGTNWTSSSNEYTPTYTDANGTTWTLYLNAAGQETGADWANAAAGTHGYVTLNADNSQYDVNYNADGSYNTVSDDGKGNVTELDFDANGNEIGDVWNTADGAHGSDTYNVDGSSAGTSVNADNSSSQYQTYVNTQNAVETDTTYYDASGTETSYSKAVTTANSDGSANVEIDTYSASGMLTEALNQQFNTAGTLVSDSWIKPDGSVGTDTFNADGSHSSSTTDAQGNTVVVTTDSAGNTTTDTFKSNGTLASVAWNSGNANVTTTTSPNADGSTTTTSTDLEDGSSSAKIVFSDGTSSLTIADGHGDTTTFAYSAAGTLTADTWTTANGTSGTDTFNADGSSSGTATYANGETSTYANDGQGDATTKYYASSGQLASDTWTKVGGSSGTDTFNSDGSSYGVTYQADGSFSTYTNDGLGDITTQDYSAAGTLLSQTQSGTSGSSTTTAYNADGSYVTTTTTAGEVIADTYSSSNVLLSDNWTKSDGSSGTDTFNAGGSSTGRTNNVDGSYSTYTNDGAGDVTTDGYNAAGILVQQVVNQSSDTTTTTYNADSSYTVSKDLSTGEIITDNYSASGILLNDAWSKPDGSSGSDIFNSDGSSSSTIHHADGSYVVTTVDTSGTSTAVHYAADGTPLWQTQTSGTTTTTTALNGYAPANSAYQDFLADGMYSISQTGTLNASTGYSILGGGAPYPANGVNVQIKLGNGTNLAAIAADSDEANPAMSVFMPGGGIVDIPDATAQSIVAQDAGQTLDFPVVGDMAPPHGDATISSNGQNLMDWGLYGSGSVIDGKWNSLLSTYYAEENSNINLAANGPAASNSNPTTGISKIVILSPATVMAMAAANNGAIKLPAGTYLQENVGNIGDPSNPPEAAPTGDGSHVSWYTETITNSTTAPPSTQQNINSVSNTVNIPAPVNVPLSDSIQNSIGGTTTEHWVAASGPAIRVANIDGPQLMSSVYSGPAGYSADYQNSGWQPYTAPKGYTMYRSTDQGSISQSGADILSFTDNRVGIPYFQGIDLGRLDEGITNSSLALALGNLKASVTYNDSTNNVGPDIKESFTENGDTLALNFGPHDAFSGTPWLEEEDWTTADGSASKIVYNSDGSSAGHIQYADGNYSILLANAHDDYRVDNYNVDGQLTSEIWQSDSGQQGTDFFTPGAQASSTTTDNADGSYTQQTIDASGDVYTNTYSASGLLENASWDLTSGSSGGTTYNADGSYTSTATTAKGDVSVDNYDASGTLLSDSWQSANGTHGSDSYTGGTLTQSTWTNPDGSYGSTAYNTDGSYTTSAVTATGDTSVDNYDASGALASDFWIDANGSSGTDTYVNGVISSDTWADASGVTGSDSYNASGALIYSKWTNTDGSWGSNTYDGNGTLTMTTATDPTGAETIQTPAGTDAITLGPESSTTLTNSGATDTVALGTTVAPDQLWFTQNGTDLVVSVLGSTENLTVKDWFNGLTNQVSAFVAGNGQTLAGSNVEQLVQAMAAFSPPTSSQIAYTAAEAANLDPVIAATWQ
ncbi:bifunctional hemolysin/adenylate cyclase precursor [mine drainage metagenome]|uniref:Bifunctional hemolysin/adenylate cyclase n=1 Tax=mine drainage metagenome TaxID=410659 RepID=A0A1J5RPS6_9ZZZZ